MTLIVLKIVFCRRRLIRRAFEFLIIFFNIHFYYLFFFKLIYYLFFIYYLYIYIFIYLYIYLFIYYLLFIIYYLLHIIIGGSRMGCVRHVLYYTGYIGVGVEGVGWGRWGELDRGGGGISRQFLSYLFYFMSIYIILG